MDHREFIKTLPRGDLAGLRQRADGPGLRHLAGHLGLIALTGTWIGFGWPLWQIALLPHGIALCFLFTLSHETTHRTPFETAWMNEWAGRMAGLPILLPFEWFRHFHLAHHKFTNIPGKDPELLAGGKPETWFDFALYLSGWRYWSGMIGQVLQSAADASPDTYVPSAARPLVVFEARIYIGLYALALLSLFFSPLMLWIWVLPVLIGQPFLRLYLLAEHGRCAFATNIFDNTRTTYTNRMVRFLAWNMPYHVEHHALPQVPFHKLPELHDLMQGRHTHLSPSYAAFSAEFIKDLRPSKPSV
ncbi:MAG: fatty acid desaturase [Pseudomonadota bacterium]